MSSLHTSEELKAMLTCMIWLTVLTEVRTKISTSLYTALEVRSDLLADLPSLDSVVREDLGTCGLSCSSQDCPGFYYHEETGLCTRLNCDCVPSELQVQADSPVTRLYIKTQFSQPCVGESQPSLSWG